MDSIVSRSLGSGDMSEKEQGSFTVVMAVVMAMAMVGSKLRLNDEFPLLGDWSAVSVGLLAAVVGAAIGWLWGMPRCKQAGARIVLAVAFLVPIVSAIGVVIHHL